MKKFLYLGLTGCMVLSSRTVCMEQEMSCLNNVCPEQELVSNPGEELGGHEKMGPHLPSKEEVIAQFFNAAKEVSEMGRYGVASSESFNTMKESYAMLKAINKGNKAQTKIELCDGYSSDDEDYYENGTENEELTHARIAQIKALLEAKYNPLIEKNGAQTKEIQKQLGGIDIQLAKLFDQKLIPKENLQINQKELKKLELGRRALENNREQENSLLRTRAASVLEEIGNIDERIIYHTNQTKNLLDADVTKSITAEDFKEHSDIAQGLTEVKIVQEKKLARINEFIVRAQSTPKKGWLPFFN